MQTGLLTPTSTSSPNSTFSDGGFYYNVHEGPSRQADNPEIACGDLPTLSTEAVLAGP